MSFVGFYLTISQLRTLSLSSNQPFLYLHIYLTYLSIFSLNLEKALKLREKSKVASPLQSCSDLKILSRMELEPQSHEFKRADHLAL